MAGATAAPATSTSTSSTTSGPICPDIKPTDDLQAFIDAALTGDTLTLCPGAFKITSTLVIGKDLTITGAGKGVTILDGEDKVRVLEVGGSRTVTLEKLTITRGSIETGSGGGIANSGNLTLRHLAVTFSRAIDGGGIMNFSGGVLTLQVSCDVKTNSAGHGGGIATTGTLTLQEGSVVSGNTGLEAGGGIYIRGAGTLGSGSTVTENTALQGGGIFVFPGGSLTMKRGSVLANNTPDNCMSTPGGCPDV